MKVVSFEKAVSYIQDEDTILIGGSGGGHAIPEALIVVSGKKISRRKRSQKSDITSSGRCWG